MTTQTQIDTQRKHLEGRAAELNAAIEAGKTVRLNANGVGLWPHRKIGKAERFAVRDNEQEANCCCEIAPPQLMLERRGRVSPIKGIPYIQ